MALFLAMISRWLAPGTSGPGLTSRLPGTAVAIAVALLSLQPASADSDIAPDLRAGRVLAGDIEVQRESIVVRSLDENGRGLLVFDLPGIQAQRFGSLRYCLSGNLDLLKVRFFWRTSGAPDKLQARRLLPTSLCPAALSLDIDAWQGQVLETGLVITGTDGGEWLPDAAFPLTVSRLALQPRGTASRLRAFLTRSMEVHYWDGASINRVPSGALFWRVITPLVGALCVGLVLAVRLSRGARRIRAGRAALAILLLYAAASSAYGLYQGAMRFQVSLREFDTMPLAERPLHSGIGDMVGLARSVSDSIDTEPLHQRVFVLAPTLYGRERLIYELLPLNAAPIQWVNEKVRAGDLLVSYGMPDLKFDERHGILYGRGRRLAAERIVAGARGAAYRIRGEASP